MAKRDKPRPQPLKKVNRVVRPRVVYVSSQSAINPTYRPRRKVVTPCSEKRWHQRKHHWLKKKYGITISDYNKMLGLQDGRCAICCTKEPKGRGSMHVDHCHATGKVRGLLCHSCNTGLGQFKDKPEMLEAAAQYLRRAFINTVKQHGGIAAMVDSVEQAQEVLT